MEFTRDSQISRNILKTCSQFLKFSIASNIWKSWDLKNLRPRTSWTCFSVYFETLSNSRRICYLRNTCSAVRFHEILLSLGSYEKHHERIKSERSLTIGRSITMRLPEYSDGIENRQIVEGPRLPLDGSWKTGRWSTSLRVEIATVWLPVDFKLRLCAPLDSRPRVNTVRIICDRSIREFIANLARTSYHASSVRETNDPTRKPRCSPGYVSPNDVESGNILF